tara:strand:+ start:6312 stop:6584 length:273 start_codon:yes stop_codon:yes gene_type:complete
MYTAEFIADIFKFAGDSVTLINRDANYAAWIERTAEGQSEDMWKAMIQRNVDHLELIKTYKHENGLSIWTTEDFTDIDAAIVKGKTLITG